jgi:lipopolysaccharide/colanic/teichoic acid biosynthesis glycosyltransferase
VIAKRAFDLAAAIAGLVMLVPFFILVAVWIVLDSPGPVFYRQVRAGRNNVPFRIFKLRTMRVNSDRFGQLTVGEDSRVTRAGRWLRRYKIDEFPQLINVLTGQMSLVGPRPEVPRYVACYPDPVRAIVLSVAPGITDWASIRFKDESSLLAGWENAEHAYVETVLPTKLCYHMLYVKERSFWSDLRIIGATLLAIVRH